MSTLRINNIEAQSVPASPTIDEKVKVTNSSGDILVNIDGKTSGITTIGINTTDGNIKFDANSNVLITGILTATTLAGNFTPDSLEVGSNIKLGNAGVITATSFVGSGANLTGIDATKIITGNTQVQTIDTGSDGHIKFTTEGSERVRIDSGGRLLVGTTSSSISSSELFEVKSTASGFSHFRNNHSGYAPIYIDNEYTNTAMAPLITITDGGGNRAGFLLDPNSVFDITGQGSISFSTGGTVGNATERVRIDSNGRILKGTSSSAYDVDIVGTERTIEIGVENNSSAYRVALNTTNNVNADFNIQHKTNLTSIGTGVNVPLCFHINGGTNAVSAEKMRLDTAGTLHIKGGNIEAGDDSFPLNFLDSISNYIGVAADGGSNNGDALFIAHSHGSGLAIFGYEAGGDRLVIGTDTGNGANKIDFLTDVGGTSGGNTDNLNGKEPKMRIANNGVITLGRPSNSALKAEVCNAVSGHQFISQCSDNNNGFEVYQQHGSTTTRNTFAVYANTGSGGAKEAQFRVRGDGKLYKGASQIYPLVNYSEYNSFSAVSVSSSSYTDLRTLVSSYTPKKAGNIIVIHHQSQCWQGGTANANGDAMWKIQRQEGGGSWTDTIENDRIMGNMDGRNYTGGSGLARHHRTVHLMGSFECAGTSINLKTLGKVDFTSVGLQWYHHGKNILQIWEYEKG